MKVSHTPRSVFDDHNLVSTAGLVPVMELAENAGLHDRLSRLTVDSPNAALKAAGLIAGMLAGADSIDDMDVLRHGAMTTLFDGIRAPSTLGTFLRTFTHGHVQQLASVNTALLASLTAQLPALLPTTADSLTFIDIDDTIRAVHGHAKQAAGYGYTGVKGLNLQLAAISTPESMPLIAATSLRRGNTNSAKGAGRLATRAINTARTAGVTGQIMTRADSAFYTHKFVTAATAAGNWYSVTARQNTAVNRALAAIDESAWIPINYTNAIYDQTEHRWISDAEVAEIAFTAFTRHGTGTPIRCRLVARRVKRLSPAPATSGAAQGELFTAHRYHAFITNSSLDTETADAVHRDHAVIEQVIAELKNNALAHLPSGKYAANAAWTALAAIAFNLARATATAAGMARARWATVRTRLITLAARPARRSRQVIMHLPANWPWRHEFEQLAATTGTSPPAPATT